MANNALKSVLSAAADLYSRSRYAVDLPTQLAEPLKRGDAIDVPSFGALSVAADGASPGSVQAVTTNALTLLANKHPAILAAMPALSSAQLMDGNWSSALAADALRQLKSSMDNTFLDEMRVAAGDSANYHVNLANAVVTADHALQAIAKMRSLDGGGRLAFFVSANGQGALQRIAGFQPSNFASGDQVYGVPQLGSLYGIPVYQSNGIRPASVATSACAIESNVCTATVPAGHGFVAGQLISLAGTTVTTASVAISSVTATTIVFALTGSDGAMADGVGTIASLTDANLLIDLDVGAYVAQQAMPRFRIVEDPSSTGDVLQASAIWGAVGRPGRIIALHSQSASIKTS